MGSVSEWESAVPDRFIRGLRETDERGMEPFDFPGGQAAFTHRHSYSNSSSTISGFEPSRRGGPQVPAPLEVNTCIRPMRLRP